MCVCVLLLNILTGFHYSHGIFGGNLFLFLLLLLLFPLNLGSRYGTWYGTWYGTFQKKIKRILR